MRTRGGCFAQCLNQTNASFMGCNMHLPLERSHLLRAVALFDPNSRFVKSKLLPSWSPETGATLRDFLVAQTQGMLFTFPEQVYLSNPINMFGSENTDSSAQITTYIALDVLAALPQYAGLKMADGDTIAQH